MSLTPEILLAPFGYILADTDGKVLTLNPAAVQLVGLQSGDNFITRFEISVQKQMHELLAGQRRTVEAEVKFDIGTRTVEFMASPADAATRHVYLTDQSELRAVARQMSQAQLPGKRFVHDLSNVMTPVSGYAELVLMMMEENDLLAGEKLMTLRRYMTEVLSGMRKTEELISTEKQRKKSMRGHHQVAPRRIVIVDDEPGITSFLGELIQSWNHEPVLFTDSEVALDYLRAHQDEVDALLLDHLMPGISGIDLATEVLSMGCRFPVILCTGDQRVISDQASGRLRIRNFLSKPIDINELDDMLAHVLSAGTRTAG
ncbi:MAG: response regulator [Pseudomonadales bacterium]|nr:response regulator [Pseudomonadales bacterium]